MPLNDHAATTIDHGLNTGLFLYKLNGLFDDLDTSIENQQHFCENDSVNSSVSGFSTEEANFLHIIDVDAILESDAQDVKSPSIRSCTDLDKPRDTKDLPGNSGLFGDESSSSEDSDDDLGFGLFDDDSDLAPATVKHQLQDSQCRGEQTSTNSIKATNTDSPDEDSEDDLDLHLFSDDEDSAVSKTVKPKSVNTTYQKQQPFHNTKSKTTNTDPVKKTVITCARVSEKDNTNFDAWFETMMGASESREFVKRSESEIDWCVICMDKFNNPRILHKCSHQFCSDCITDYFKVRPQCPVCFVVYGVIEGNQPRDGTMTHSINNRLKLPGYEKHKTIIVYYDFPDGVQTEEHPNPGQNYYGTSRTAYLPDDEEGRKVLKLLQEAFKRRLVFTVGRSRTTGADNQVTWNDIHHKTCTNGGQQGFGYPDPTYLARVQEELAAFGVTEENIRENT